jgi:hypothetical protein
MTAVPQCCPCAEVGEFEGFEMSIMCKVVRSAFSHKAFSYCQRIKEFEAMEPRWNFASAQEEPVAQMPSLPVCPTAQHPWGRKTDFC